MNTYMISLPLFLKDSTVSALLHRGKTQTEHYTVEVKSFMKIAAGPEDCLLFFTWYPWYVWEVVCCAPICPLTQLSDLTVLFPSLHLPVLFMQLENFES